MVNKITTFVLSSILLAGMFIPVIGQTKKKPVPQTWETAVLNAKTTLRDALSKHKMPVQSEVVRRGQAATPMKVDVSGLDQLILYTWETPDGNGSDHGVWGNARLTTTDGKTVWLDELKPVYEKAGWGSVKRNKNLSDNPLSIAGKKFEHGILCHASGEIVFALGKKYKTFEAEVGIDDGAGGGSVVFKVQNISGRSVVEQLQKEYGSRVARFVSFANVSPDIWLATPDASVERRAVANVIKRMKDNGTFTAELEKADALKTVNERIVAYFGLLDKAAEVLNLEEQLAWVNLQALREAFEDMKKTSSFDAAANGEKLKFIEANYADVVKNIGSGNPEVVAKAKAIVKAKRDVLMANPVLDIDKIVVERYRLGANDRKAMAPSLGTQNNNWSSQPSARRYGFDAEICELSNLRGDIKSRTIFKPDNTSAVTDLQLHWDGDRLLFTMADDKNRWQVYQVGVDGKNLKQMIVSEEPDLHFCDANYLPDGRIVATSNMGYHGVPCVNGWDAVCNLVQYDPEKKKLRRLTFDQDGNWNPVVMNNGRLMYIRWEYTDLTHYFSRIVMHMNPDGTDNRSLYGSGSFWPNSTFDVKPLPGNTSRFVGVISGHHGVARSGRLMLFDPAKSRKEEKGVIQEIPFKGRKIIPEVKDQLVDGVWPQFIKPYPLDDKYFLVAAKLSPSSLWGIYLTDVFNNLTLVAEFEGEGLIAPIPLRKSPTPPVIPDRVNLDDKESTIFIQDLYEGEGLPGVPRGTVKELRIFAYEFAYNYSPSDHYAQGIQAGWDIKRLLGTVPVEKDGSAIFKVPANTPISIQPLDGEGRAVQWMRSWISSMPGETVSCVGCHEDQNQIPMPKRVVASTIAPHKIKEPEGGVRSFTFNLEIQPILDRACVACHNESKPSLDFRSGRTESCMDWAGFKREFETSYLAVMPYFYRQGPEAEMYVLKPYEYHVSNSELIRMLKKGHYGVELTDEEWKTLYAWIDMNMPDAGRFDNITPFNGFDQYTRRIELADKYSHSGVDWRKELSDYADYLKGKGEIEPVMPKPGKEVKYKEVKVAGWPFDTSKAKAMQGEAEKKVIEVAPGVKMTFVKIPAGKFVMGSNVGESDHAPEFKTEVKKAFWMAETEVTNEQFCALFPEHNSRIIGQFWKDHTTAGYPANKPQQPVIRVSWEEAMEYCKKLGEKTGFRMTLPTEVQWEWAAKAGSDDNFWYGDNNTDFSTYENLADAQLSNMAVTGVNPQPMSKNDPWRKFYDYLPKAASVDDGEMIVCEVGKYKPNPWGLYDIHGNVEEWTNSDYLPYPYKDKLQGTGTEKVVRGGSWIDRPKFATANTRKAFYPWQKVFNVGFRVIIEE